MNPDESIEFPNLEALKAALENKTDALGLLATMTGTKTEILANLAELTDNWPEAATDTQDEV